MFKISNHKVSPNQNISKSPEACLGFFLKPKPNSAKDKVIASLLLLSCTSSLAYKGHIKPIFIPDNLMPLNSRSFHRNLGEKKELPKLIIAQFTKGTTFKKRYAFSKNLHNFFNSKTLTFLNDVSLKRISPVFENIAKIIIFIFFSQNDLLTNNKSKSFAKQKF